MNAEDFVALINKVLLYALKIMQKADTIYTRHGNLLFIPMDNLPEAQKKKKGINGNFDSCSSKRLFLLLQELFFHCHGFSFSFL